MTASLLPITAPAWSGAVLKPAQEFGPVPLTTIAGEIPSGLKGSLYRNGPARLERGDQRVGHWFDGDGGILAVQFEAEGATGLYRYVQTSGYQAEQQADRYLFSNYGMVTPGQWWQRFGKPIKNVANTSVLALPDRLLALWEGGPPHALSLHDLATRGLDELGELKGHPYSAHPKRDPVTGEIYNFGVGVGRKTVLHLYRSSPNGRIQQQSVVSLQGVPLIHDFVLAGRYLVFCISPVRVNVVPVLLQLQSFSDAMQWQPQLGTEILVIDRETLDLVNHFEVEPWFQWHFGNGYELSDGTIVLHVAAYPDFQTNQRLKEVASGRVETPASATLQVLRINPTVGRLLERVTVFDRSCDFPIVNPLLVGQLSHYTYLTAQRERADQGELFGAIVRVDHQTGAVTEADLGEGRYPSEVVYAPDRDQLNQGWLLTVVYDGNRDTSEVWIYDADRLSNPPVCCLGLPAVVPLSFHGTWAGG